LATSVTAAVSVMIFGCSAHGSHGGAGARGEPAATAETAATVERAELTVERAGDRDRDPRVRRVSGTREVLGERVARHRQAARSDPPKVRVPAGPLRDSYDAALACGGDWGACAGGARLARFLVAT